MFRSIDQQAESRAQAELADDGNANRTFLTVQLLPWWKQAKSHFEPILEHIEMPCDLLAAQLRDCRLAPPVRDRILCAACKGVCAVR